MNNINEQLEKLVYSTFGKFLIEFNLISKELCEQTDSRVIEAVILDVSAYSSNILRCTNLQTSSDPLELLDTGRLNRLLTLVRQLKKVKNLTNVPFGQGDGGSIKCTGRIENTACKETPSIPKPLNRALKKIERDRVMVIWKNIIRKCTNAETRNYDRYGGLGISVCERWHNFDNFYEDMSPCPPKMSVDRRDLSKDFSKENCFWNTKSNLQNRLITYCISNTTSLS